MVNYISIIEYVYDIIGIKCYFMFVFLVKNIRLYSLEYNVLLVFFVYYMGNFILEIKCCIGNIS